MVLSRTLRSAVVCHIGATQRGLAQMATGHIPRPVVLLDDEDVIVVTGAGTAGHTSDELWGIGAATAAHAVASGGRVGVLDVDLAAAERTVARIRRLRPDRAERVIPLRADVCAEDDVERALGELRDAFGPISGVVNNVGVGGPGGTASTVDLDRWAHAFDVNVTSMVRVVRAALSDLERTRGSVVNVSSLAGLRGGHHALSYPVTKTAVVGLSQTMAAHHGPDGVRVNTLVPGLVYTPMVADRGLSDDGRAHRASLSMLGTEGSAWDIAAPAVFLLSAAASWITGIVLPVDAGLGSVTRDLGVPANV